ncbi:MAG: histidine kinase dimerization/phospho-acceptor domain-containing protein [Thermodesulfobacteriota bacterium]
MTERSGPAGYDFKGIGFSKVGHFKEVRSKIKELEHLNVELAARHNELEAIINSISDGMTILDENLQIVFVNKIQSIMFPEGTLAGRPCYQAFFRKERPCKDCPAQRTLQTGGTQRGEILIKEGGYTGQYYEWTVSPILNPYGKVSQVILLMRNITQRKEYEHNLLQADRMAAIGLLAASIGHEINNPLTSIAGFSEGLLKRLSRRQGCGEDGMLDSCREYLEIILNESYRCKDIVQNLLQYSRQSSDEPGILAVNEIVDATASLLRQHAKERRIKITVKNVLAAGFGYVFGHESQLKHLFLNIFNLALRAMNGGGTITAVERNSGNLIEVMITAEAQNRFSRRFEVLIGSACSEDRRLEGSPIDLSVCYTIMRSHNGEVSFDIEGEKKATFRLRFPAIMPDAMNKSKDSR